MRDDLFDQIAASLQPAGSDQVEDVFQIACAAPNGTVRRGGVWSFARPRHQRFRLASSIFADTDLIILCSYLFVALR